MNEIIEELKWRGLFRQGLGSLEENLKAGEYFYVGTDPTADSLGIHHLTAFMTAKILQRYGLKPLILIGGATASLGDPSFKTTERAKLPMETIMHNCNCIKNQLSKVLDFDESRTNHATFVNNYDWMSKFSFLDFMRDIGKCVTVNYMMAKDSVKTRLSREGQGLSFCEFSYSNIQAYDFIHLYEQYGCKIQCGGVDQTGNIDSAFEIARKRNKVNNLSALVWDLITDSNGNKFGKSEGNAVWLDAEKTSPYEFYQFWINQSDADAEKLSKMFLADRSIENIKELIEEHKKKPEARLLQKTLAHDVTSMIHGEDAFNKAVAASNILFGKSNADELSSLDEKTFNAVMRDVPKVEIAKDSINGMSVLDFLSDTVKLGSKTELRKLINSGSISINMNKIEDMKLSLTSDSFLKNGTILVQKGKKKHFLIIGK